MYEENENKIEWGPILKKVGIILAVVLVIFGIILLVGKCSNGKIDEKKPNNPTEYTLEKQLDELEKATLTYLTKDNLPTTLNASKTIRLKILVNNKIVDSIVADDKTTCDTNESYSEITRLENNYAVKMSLTCGKNKASRVIYVGCFESCNGEICKGEENQTGGICGEPTTTDPNENNNNNGPVEPNINNTTNNNQSSSNGVVKPNITPGNNNSNSNNNNSNSNNNNSNNNNNTSNNNNNNNGSSNNTTSKIVMYEFQKCSMGKAYCTQGEMNSYGSCDIYGWVTLDDGKVITLGGTQSSTRKVAAKKTEKVIGTEYFSRPTDAKNTSTIRYEFVKITNNMLYQYKKIQITEYCDGGVKPQGGWCYYTTGSNTSGSKTCEDKTYTYNASTGKCTKTVSRVVNTVPSTPGKQTCETTWSTQTYLPGWTRTGRTK